MSTLVHNTEKIEYKGFVIEPSNNNFQVCISAKDSYGKSFDFVVKDDFLTIQSAKQWIDNNEKT